MKDYPPNEIHRNDAEEMETVDEILDLKPEDIFSERELTKMGWFELADKERTSLLGALHSISATEDGDVKLRLVKAILINNKSSEVELPELLGQLGRGGYELPTLLNDKSVVALVTVMSRNIELYRFPLSMLLTFVKISNLPEEVIENIKPIIHQNELKVISESDHWSVCPSGEHRLLNSIDDMAIVAVNGILLVKMIGRFSALCTETVTTREGFVFMRGCWYSPVDSPTREDIEEAFDDGIGLITLTRGVWALMRSGTGTVESSLDEIIEKTKTGIEKCRGKLPETIRGMSRSAFRQKSRDYF